MHFDEVIVWSLNIKAYVVNRPKKISCSLHNEIDFLTDLYESWLRRGHYNSTRA